MLTSRKRCQNNIHAITLQDGETQPFGNKFEVSQLSHSLNVLLCENTTVLLTYGANSIAISRTISVEILEKCRNK